MASSSSSSIPQPSHHVFPSFRGEDVRRDFLSHIQMELKRQGISTFIDNEIERGEFIGPELIRAIRGSKIAIILLSRNYASSSWCLDELAEIMNCREELGQKVMTVFYEVDPSDVRKLAGDFGNVFRKTCAGKTEENIRRWTKALKDVANIAGYHSTHWDNEAAMINEIATDISNKLNLSAQLWEFDRFVGMRAHLEKMEELLCLDSIDVRMVGIWGPPGIGKTTIARVVYHKHSYMFQESVFMESIETRYTIPYSDDYSAKLHLQEQFMSQITNRKDIKISHLGLLRGILYDKKVLVVLDGVNHCIQLDAMAKEHGWFGYGSRIIITTKDLSLLRAYGINDIYEVGIPSTDEALQILCLKAFGQNSPKDGFEELAWKVTGLAGKLPLGLRIMGSYLRGRSKNDWIETLPRLRTTLDADIHRVLRISYDALHETDKDLFLHIACFFNHAAIKKIEAYLEHLLNVRLGLKILAYKSLIYVDTLESVSMHSLVAHLGRYIVRQQSHNPGRRQFLLDAREVCYILSNDIAGSEDVMGINFNFSSIEETIHIHERAFERMSNLRFLKFDGGPDILHFPHGLNHLSQNLRLLHWRHFPLTYLPFANQQFLLVELFMPHSKLQRLWEGNKNLRHLKWMDLSNSVNLMELPDLSTATSLETLNLSDCSSLVKLPFTIKNAKNLQTLNLRNCSSLNDLPSIGDATNLNELDLTGCSRLVELPHSIGNAINLKELDLTGCSCLLDLPSSIGNATSLEILILDQCSSLLEVPYSIGNLQKLQNFRLRGCSKLKVLPTNINLKSLNTLDLTDCLLLKCFPEISTNITILHLKGTAIEEVPSSIQSCSRLTQLYMSYSEKLKDFPLAFDYITHLYMSDKEIQHVRPWVKKISGLNKLILKKCRKLVSLPQIPGYLSFMDAEDCESLERLCCSFQNPNVCLNFAKCFKLNQEARDLIIQTQTRSHAVLPGVEVPAYFTHRATTGGSLTIQLNEKPLPTSMRFKACVLMVSKGDEAGDLYEGTDAFFVKCNKNSKYMYPLLGEHLYIFEVRVEVTSSELAIEFKVDLSDHWKIRECGVRQLSDYPMPKYRKPTLRFLN